MRIGVDTGRRFCSIRGKPSVETAARTDKTATGEWLSPPGCRWSPSDTRPSCLFQHSRRRHHMLPILHAASCGKMPFSRQPFVIKRFKPSPIIHRSIADWRFEQSYAQRSLSCDFCGETAEIVSIDDRFMERQSAAFCVRCYDWRSLADQGEDWPEALPAGNGRDRRSGDHPCDPTIGGHPCDG